MLRLCVPLLLVCFAAAKDGETWPFKLADKYIEEFKSHVDDLKTSAYNYQHEYQSQEQVLEVDEHNLKNAVKHAEHFDFIIVGGGTSGSVLASRLSEIPEWKILLLEAGNIENMATRVPKNWEVLRNTPFNWAYETTPQNYSCLAMLDHKCTIPTGRILGGTSAINSMVYTRGNQRDYDLWADQGNKGWCWGDVLPIFKKIEDAHFEHFDKYYHHLGGRVHLENPQHLTFLSNHALKAAEELDIHTVDYNGKKQLGISIPQLISDCGKRMSAADAYLKPAEKRENLVVRPLTHVLRVLLSTHTKEAQGVEYVHDGKIFIAKAEKEVILSAGALNTPKILILSGIGPKEDCKRLHIDTVSDLKVGHNLNMRPSFIGLDLVYNHTDPEHLDEYYSYLKYLKDGKGPLTSPGIDAIAYLKTDVSKKYKDYPDIELQFVTKHGVEFKDFNWMKLSKIHYDSIWKPLEHEVFVKAIITLNHPHSKGIVTLRSNNPLQNPIIDPHFFTDEDEIDYHTMLGGIRKALKLIHTEEFQKLGLTINHHAIHGCEETKFGSDEYWECAIKYLVVPTEDASGTAKMGPETDSTAVVDKELKVYGVHKLRVADASVIPVPITGNLIAPSMMIGEKAAHLIIEEWLEEHH